MLSRQLESAEDAARALVLAKACDASSVRGSSKDRGEVAPPRGAAQQAQGSNPGHAAVICCSCAWPRMSRASRPPPREQGVRSCAPRPHRPELLVSRRHGLPAGQALHAVGCSFAGCARSMPRARAQAPSRLPGAGGLMTGSLTRANALPPPMSPSLASSLAPRQKPETNAWLATTLPAVAALTD